MSELASGPSLRK